MRMYCVVRARAKSNGTSGQRVENAQDVHEAVPPETTCRYPAHPIFRPFQLFLEAVDPQASEASIQTGARL